MRKLVSRKKVVIGALALLFLFSLNLVSAEVRGLAISASSPLQAALWQAGSALSTFFAGGNVRTENEALQQENLALQSEIVALQELARENEELRTLLEFGLREEFILVPGEIIAKSIAADTIVVRAGREQGVREGMPVITSAKVAVGRVVEVFARHALVQLISAKKSSLDAEIAETQAAGLIRGQGAQKILLDLVPQEESLRAGDLVVTSNLGDVFPESLLIGEVTEILKTGADPFQKAGVQPFFHLRTAELVFIIISQKL